MFRTPLSRFRTISIVEGVSFLLLLGVAMPLKYLGGMPKAVTIAGSVHGALFLAYLYFLMGAASQQKWPASKSLTALIAGVVPFMPFWFERKLASEPEISGDSGTDLS